MGLAVFLCALPLVAADRIAHFYAVNEPASWESLRSNAAHIKLLSPEWFTLDEQGKLQSRVDPAILNWAKSRRLRLMPLINNAKFQGNIIHALLESEGQQTALAEQLAEISRGNGFWGMQLDFENIPPLDRDRYTQFVGKLAREFRRRHLKLSIAVPAPLRPATAGEGTSAWMANERAAAFDYRELGRLADFITLMSYDQSVSEPGPIAGLPWVEVCLQAVLPEIPRKKLLLGVALFYRQWTRPIAAPAQAYVVSEGPYPQALQLAKQWNAPVELDATQQEERIVHADATERHFVWLGSAKTLRQRLELMKRYRLAGFSAWRLGQEDPAIWKNAVSGKR